MTAGKNMPEDNFVKHRNLKRRLVELMKTMKVGEAGGKRIKRKNREWLNMDRGLVLITNEEKIIQNICRICEY